MSAPSAKRIRRSLCSGTALQMVIDGDDSDIPEGSDDENLTDGEDEAVNVDLCVVNSWLLYMASRPECTIQLATFKIEIARGLIL